MPQLLPDEDWPEDTPQPGEEDWEDEQEVEEEEDKEEDFSDLDALLAEATAATVEERALKAAKKRLAKVVRSNHPDAASEEKELVATIRRLEEGRVWITVGAVALFYTQTCSVCDSVHKFFAGWMAEQKHTSDPNARRLIAGKPVECLPEHPEEHNHGLIECCANCIESCIAIDVATGLARGED